MGTVGWLHMLSAIVAIGFGTAIVLGTKGTRRHVLLGRSYLAAQIVCCGTAFGIYELYGGWGQFHWMATFEVGCIAAGMIPLLARRRITRWKERHAFYMSWSYVGLLAAAAAEVTTRIFDAPFDAVTWSTVAIVVYAGSRVVRSRLGRAWLPPRALTVSAEAS